MTEAEFALAAAAAAAASPAERPVDGFIPPPSAAYAWFATGADAEYGRGAFGRGKLGALMRAGIWGTAQELQPEKPLGGCPASCEADSMPGSIPPEAMAAPFPCVGWTCMGKPECDAEPQGILPIPPPPIERFIP